MSESRFSRTTGEYFPGQLPLTKESASRRASRFQFRILASYFVWKYQQADWYMYGTSICDEAARWV
jgi:hypothetical protein